MSVTAIAIGTGVVWAWSKYRQKKLAEAKPTALMMLEATPPMEAAPETAVMPVETLLDYGASYGFALSVNYHSTQLNSVAAEITGASSIAALQASVINAQSALTNAAKAGVTESKTFLSAAGNLANATGGKIEQAYNWVGDLWLVGGAGQTIIDALVKHIPYASVVIDGFKFLKNLIVSLIDTLTKAETQIAASEFGLEYAVDFTATEQDYGRIVAEELGFKDVRLLSDMTAENFSPDAFYINGYGHGLAGDTPEDIGTADTRARESAAAAANPNSPFSQMLTDTYEEARTAESLKDATYWNAGGMFNKDGYFTTGPIQWGMVKPCTKASCVLNRGAKLVWEHSAYKTATTAQLVDEMVNYYRQRLAYERKLLSVEEVPIEDAILRLGQWRAAATLTGFGSTTKLYVPGDAEKTLAAWFTLSTEGARNIHKQWWTNLQSAGATFDSVTGAIRPAPDEEAMAYAYYLSQLNQAIKASDLVEVTDLHDSNQWGSVRAVWDAYHLWTLPMAYELGTATAWSDYYTSRMTVLQSEIQSDLGTTQSSQDYWQSIVQALNQTLADAGFIGGGTGTSTGWTAYITVSNLIPQGVQTDPLFGSLNTAWNDINHGLDGTVSNSDMNILDDTIVNNLAALRQKYGF